MKQVLFLALPIVLLCSCQGSRTPSSVTSGAKKMDVTSTAFKEGGDIPRQYTCDGDDISPPLAWTGTPSDTKSLVVIADDPDAPSGTWVHWVVYHLPPTVQSLAEKTPPDQILANGARQGTNDFGKIGYGGPCPPSGTHRYFFKVYALNTTLDLPPGRKKADVEKAMQGHVLTDGQLMGRYSRQK